MGCQGKRIFWVTVLLCCLLAGTAYARDLVSGVYISSAGKTIILDLEVLGPSTGNLIVHQFLPPRVDIVNSMPSAMKFDKNKGQVQWLMKKVKPGKVRITMELSEPLQPGLVRAEVRCRDQETGQMMDLRINP